MVHTSDQDLVPTAIAEFHTARDNGRSDAQAWEAVVARMRFDVLRMAIALCSVEAARFAPGSPEAEGVRACITAIEQRMRDRETSI